ncbi:MAG TPA: hypothetical protein VMW25_03370 [Clostridia bacterium]|nr:hypothetical protein [Clostridia bacterium]
MICTKCGKECYIVKANGRKQYYCSFCMTDYHYLDEEEGQEEKPERELLEKLLPLLDAGGSNPQYKNLACRVRQFLAATG